MELSWSGPPAHHRAMRTFPIVVGTAARCVAARRDSAPGTRCRSLGRRVRRSRVTQICAGALLFDGMRIRWAPDPTRSRSHSDIRASTARRLARVTALPVPPELKRTNSRWISSQRRLASLFARTCVRIYDTIDAAHTPAQQATLPERLEKLVHAPDPMRLAAGRLELALHVPDCTGGG